MISKLFGYRHKMLSLTRIAFVCSLAFAFVGTTVIPADAGWYKKKHKISKSFSAGAEFEIGKRCFAPINNEFDDVISDMINKGYEVEIGEIGLYNEETSNIYIPFAYDNTDYLHTYFPATDESSRRMAGADILFFEICTPSANWYFGFEHYNAVRVLDQDNPNTITDSTVLQASLGDPLNPAKYNTHNGPNDPFTGSSLIAVTGDEVSWNDLQSSLAVAGLGDKPINLQVIPQALFMNAESESTVPRDRLSYLMRFMQTRMPHPDGVEIGRENFFNLTHPLFVFRKLGVGVEPRQPLFQDVLDPTPPFSQVLIKKIFRHKFDRLVRTVVREFERKYDLEFIGSTPFVPEGGTVDDGTVDGQAANIFDHGEFCIENQVDCQFDKRDSHYSWDQESHTLGDDDYYLLIGVDHTKLGMAEVSQASTWFVKDPDNGNVFKIIDSLSDKELEEYSISDVVKIRRWFERFTARKSFMVQVTRPSNCIENVASFGGTNCLDTDTLANNDHFVFTGELTLNPKTGTRPDDDQVIPWRLLHFKVSNP